MRFYHASYNGEPIRIAALLQPVYDDSMRGIALIQVGETLDARRGLSNQIHFNTLLWQAGMLLAVAALVWSAAHAAGGAQDPGRTGAARIRMRPWRP